MTIAASDVATELGRSAPPALGSTEYNQWTQWIDDVLMVIEDRLGDTAELDQTKLDYVVRKAVSGYVRWMASTIRDIVDENGRVVGQTEPAQGEIRILDTWWALLDEAVTYGAWSVQPDFEDDTSDDANLWYPIFT